MTATREQIIDRVAVVWSCLLGNPTFDNGETHPERAALGHILAGGQPDTPPDDISKLCGAMRSVLIEDWVKSDDRGYPYHGYMSVDYGPDHKLDAIVKKAGVTGPIKWPWKTSVSFGSNYVSVREGYGAVEVYHYPLDEKRWFVIELSGPAMEYVLQAVRDGNQQVIDMGRIEQ